MIYENIEDVVKLRNIIKSIQKAYSELSSVEERYKNVDPCGVKPINIGYNCNISIHRDGSGAGIDLSGCYVGGMVYDSVKACLEARFEDCLSALESYGVDVSNVTLEDK